MTLLRALLTVALSYAAALGACDAPGEGEAAERGYARAKPVITALAAFRADSGRYPGALAALVPKYLPAAALALPESPRERYPLDYRLADGEYTLGFRYAGPGMNECTYRSDTAAWRCRGYY